MIGTILLVIAGIFAVIILAGFFIASSFSFQRTMLMNADKKIIFNTVDDLHTWKSWSAWSPDNDPAIKINYSGKESGNGAVMEWKGKKMGNGTMEIVRTDPYRTIEITIAFNKGLFRIESLFSLEESDNSVNVTWKMNGKTKRSTIAKLLGRQFGKWMAKDMETGLTLLKRLCEGK